MNLSITIPDVTYVVWLLSQAMQDPRQLHWDTACSALRYLKGAWIKVWFSDLDIG